MDETDVRTQPESVVATQAEGLRISWGDRHESVWTLTDIRKRCPCAVCNELRTQGEAVWPRPGAPTVLDVLDAKLIGAFGITFHWNDGHQTGIYGWDVLRAACPCRKCRKQRTGTDPLPL